MPAALRGIAPIAPVGRISALERRFAVTPYIDWREYRGVGLALSSEAAGMMSEGTVSAGASVRTANARRGSKVEQLPNRR
jgi:hypothetical protein